MITIHNLHKTIDKQKILSGIHLSIKENECVGLIGPNGAGKTTLLKCLMGILSYESGDVLFDTQPIETCKKHIGYLSQYTDFKAWMTCKESLLFFGKLSGVKKETLENRIQETLKEVGLYEKQHFKVEQLSGGMKQRLGIAQAILHNPRFLILDEPVASLDPIGRSEIRKLIMHLKQRMTILLSTHILHDTNYICDRYIVMKNGQIIGNINQGDQPFDSKQLLVKLKDPAQINETREYLEFVCLEELTQDTFLVTGAEAFDLKKVITAFSFNKIEVISIGFYEKGLEDMFLELAADI
ncbi:ABC transporter ATP-binding protein [Exiguobacterium antarcticum]|uniref:ABC transporter ATP-binding protein n=1 Tax=Exiguobacterium antarcticum TaxID=132920 RepID=UPI00047A203C|nr:ABC transporter ATP-binding protein [Exiguobacterium antarcticum]